MKTYAKFTVVSVYKNSLTILLYQGDEEQGTDGVRFYIWNPKTHLDTAGLKKGGFGKIEDSVCFAAQTAIPAAIRALRNKKQTKLHDLIGMNGDLDLKEALATANSEEITF